jgi:NAD(P)-dependent dehydrogenase (short-subunit alcohol dehydrogenase family)
MPLERKNAIIYGGGAIGSAEGARVYLAGRTLEKLERAAEVIRGDGRQAQTAQLDALDEMAVDAHADGVARDAGSIDISRSSGTSSSRRCSTARPRSRTSATWPPSSHPTERAA